MLFIAIIYLKREFSDTETDNLLELITEFDKGTIMAGLKMALVYDYPYRLRAAKDTLAEGLYSKHSSRIILN
ncbi:hypothetical protein HYT23_00565 [Candidatus Pacearchaeota archaeon]|nr:hypothetical protein [Candidatus Pacearchaeota archaeon]